MALWKAVADRYDLLLATWDSGRVGAAERERLATLVWGRLDASLDPRCRRAPARRAAAAALAVSLPEACRLSDALAASLRARLSVDPAGRRRHRPGRGRCAPQVERIRDQVDREPAGSRRERADRLLHRLDGRVADVAARRQRGADVGGLLGPLEDDAARAERDLIVGGAQPPRGRRATRRGPARCAPSSRPAAPRCATWPPRCVAAVAPRAPLRRARRRGARAGAARAAPRSTPTWPGSDDRRPRADAGPGGLRRRARASATSCSGRLEAYRAKATARRRRPGRGRPPRAVAPTWPSSTAGPATCSTTPPPTWPAPRRCSRRTRPIWAAARAPAGRGRPPHERPPPPAPSRAAPGTSWTATATSAAARRRCPPPDRASVRQRRTARPAAGRAGTTPGSTATSARRGRRRALDRLARLQPAGVHRPRLGPGRARRHAASPAGSAPPRPGCAARGSAPGLTTDPAGPRGRRRPRRS